MIGLIYIFLCFTVGWAICTFAFPGLGNLTETDYYHKKIAVSPCLLLFPAWFITGTLAVTWAVYLIAYQFGNTQKPLFYANMIVLPVAFLFSVFALYFCIKQKWKKTTAFCDDKKSARIELILVTAITALAFILMWTTFFISGDKLYVGVSVFSDFSPHIGMIRSFSYGNNFPTSYAHYAGQDIRYHFMFQFLVGNLEYLGMRLDYAFNIPSILSLISAFLLLYIMAVKITGKRLAGLLSCLFFAFRSAKTLFTFLANIPAGTDIFKALADNVNFISDTPNEDWGLWNLNVYCNQRHLAFGLAAIFLVIIIFLPHLFDMFENIREKREERKNDQQDFLEEKLKHLPLQGFGDGIKTIFFTKEGWMVQDLKGAIASGILLGSLAFFHGAAELCCLMILFMMAVLSKNRLEYLITAVITVLLSTLQTHLFIHGSVVSTKLFLGFIAENKTLFGTLSYLDKLLGILPFVLLVAFCLEKGVGRYLMLAFTVPLIFAFTVSLTVDVTVNHKYIMMSCILLGIFAASLLTKLLEQKDILIKFVAIFLIVILTSTGVYDFITVLKKNTPSSAVVLDLKAPITKWVKDNSDSKDIFLTSNYALNQIVLGGAMLYEGWDYFPWSAGYNTNEREEQVKLMYEAKTPADLDALVKKNKIRYIVVDRDNRESDAYVVNEANIRATYQSVYTEGEGEWKTSIYDTEKPVE